MCPLLQIDIRADSVPFCRKSLNIILKKKKKFLNFTVLLISFQFGFVFQCREIGLEIHEEILRVLHELYTTMKTYQAYQTECKQAETKLKLAETQRHKIEQSIPKDKLEKSKKFRIIEKEVQKVSSDVFCMKCVHCVHF